MVDLAMSIYEFPTQFLIFWHPWHPWVCIRSDLKSLETDISDSSYCVQDLVGIEKWESLTVEAEMRNVLLSLAASVGNWAVVQTLLESAMFY